VPVVPAVPVINAAAPAGQVAVAAPATQAVDAVVVTAPPGEGADSDCCHVLTSESRLQLHCHGWMGRPLQHNTVIY
jgi:hypothetical protein